MAPLVWFITGTTSGLGATLLPEIVARGDKVVAAGRNVEKKIGHLKSDNIAILEFDIGAARTEVNAKIREAWEIFGHIDVVVNNAGISRSTTAEEADDELIEHMFNINTFGHMRVTQAVLPLFREQSHGKLVFISSFASDHPLPFMTFYGASKAALASWVYGLSTEVRDLGIECMLVDTGGFNSTLGHPRPGYRGGEGFGAVPVGAAYQPLFNEFVGGLAADPEMFYVSEPDKVASRLVDVVRSEGTAAGRAFPLNLLLGTDAIDIVRRRAEMRLENVAKWESFSRSTDRENREEARDRGIQVMIKHGH